MNRIKSQLVHNLKVKTVTLQIHCCMKVIDFELSLCSTKWLKKKQSQILDPVDWKVIFVGVWKS